MTDSPPPLPPASELPLAEVITTESQVGNLKSISTPLAKNGDWTAIWSTDNLAYYFWNSKTQKTTWENPLEVNTSAPLPCTSSSSSITGSSTIDRYDGIDPELTYLDPSYNSSNSIQDEINFSTFARFNNRTGKFQGDSEMNPDRINDFNKSERQQQAFYDTKSWNESLDGKGLGKGFDQDGKPKKKPTAKQVVSSSH